MVFPPVDGVSGAPGSVLDRRMVRAVRAGSGRRPRGVNEDGPAGGVRPDAGRDGHRVDAAGRWVGGSADSAGQAGWWSGGLTGWWAG
ncbi:hypothetical protein KSE_30810 [Kitasatospora setae KM-6054]|uniref:Uncharacterized protein n=1 Tax=Kitasatospora setae (strain ATCC 33774 / DSM 43861 / JCM 3304 / KCC A-0304 / NBRC 14216 / KM-6054) TaxID=452652 RepID=E4NCG1_KITSK|nr:hypothetical protein KSE_30810 [Kitasatospora setae KM-6054]